MSETESRGQAVFIGSQHKSVTQTFVCQNKACENVYINFREPSDAKTCGDCGREMERLTEEHLKPLPGEMEKLRAELDEATRKDKATLKEKRNDFISRAAKFVFIAVVSIGVASLFYTHSA